MCVPPCWSYISFECMVFLWLCEGIALNHYIFWGTGLLAVGHTLLFVLLYYTWYTDLNSYTPISLWNAIGDQWKQSLPLCCFSLPRAVFVSQVLEGPIQILWLFCRSWWHLTEWGQEGMQRKQSWDLPCARLSCLLFNLGTQLPFLSVFCA
jgi:hypothetical protein